MEDFSPDVSKGLGDGQLVNSFRTFVHRFGDSANDLSKNLGLEEHALHFWRTVLERRSIFFFFLLRYFRDRSIPIPRSQVSN